ncbi:MAG TPA: phage holin family protein [Actinomycetota bacterium]|jgi:VIT1/CCC1 family predicted Fe2+/Mn2+ transporter|nr:phage holin family protein [Actinomycetota bacterium]
MNDTTRIRQHDGYNEKSAGALMKEVTEDLSTLVRKEVELAKQELGRSVSAKLKGAVILGIVGLVGVFALIFLLLAIRDGLDVVLATWLADLASAGILLLLAALGALIAKKKLATPISAEMTKQTIKDDVEFAKSIGRKNP